MNPYILLAIIQMDEATVEISVEMGKQMMYVVVCINDMSRDMSRFPRELVKPSSGPSISIYE